MSITVDRYTYTPNLLLNKRLTPPLKPSGRNPSLHPRIISHFSRYTKERAREKERAQKKDREMKRKNDGSQWVKKCMGVTAQRPCKTAASWEAMHGKTEIKRSYVIERTSMKMSYLIKTKCVFSCKDVNVWIGHAPFSFSSHWRREKLYVSWHAHTPPHSIHRST